MHSRWRRAGALVTGLALLAAQAVAAEPDATEQELEKFRQMMKADPWTNPALLDADRGAELWQTARGPKNISLQTCDLGQGPGVVKGAFAQLPRFFADADRVLDVEARIVWCMQRLQGFALADIDRRVPAAGFPVKDLGALVTFVASQSAGQVFAAPMLHPKEQQAVALGEALFFRRQGPFDFSCATCHGDAGRRIRLQKLPYLQKPEEARTVIGEWPAYRVSASHVMTMQHRILDCFWQMRMPEIEHGSEATVALTAYLVGRADGGPISAPAIKR